MPGGGLITFQTRALRPARPLNPRSNSMKDLTAANCSSTHVCRLPGLISLLYLKTEYHEGHRANFSSADLVRGRGRSAVPIRVGANATFYHKRLSNHSHV
jgi:hypothetical protein